MRETLSEWLDGDGKGARALALVIYALIIVSAFVISIETLPDLSPTVTATLRTVEVALLLAFAVEYIARLVAAEKWWRFAFSFWGIVDLLAILPGLVLLAPDWTALRTLRLLRVLRLLKLFRADQAMARLTRAVYGVRAELAVFGFLALVVLYLAAVGIYHFEKSAQPEVFSSIPASLWWATATLTTVGYGDVFPVTTGGRVFTAAILMVGLGVVAVPAGLITSALIDEFSRENAAVPTETTNNNQQGETS